MARARSHSCLNESRHVCRAVGSPRLLAAWLQSLYGKSNASTSLVVSDVVVEIAFCGFNQLLGCEMNTENGQVNQSSSKVDNQAGEPKKMSRREALALVGKHAVYTAPAVLAVLAVTKSDPANARDCGGLPCSN